MENNVEMDESLVEVVYQSDEAPDIVAGSGCTCCSCCCSAVSSSSEETAE